MLTNFRDSSALASIFVTGIYPTNYTARHEFNRTCQPFQRPVRARQGARHSAEKVMTIKIAINGFGRMGRLALRAACCVGLAGYRNRSRQRTGWHRRRCRGGVHRQILICGCSAALLCERDPQGRGVGAHQGRHSQYRHGCERSTLRPCQAPRRHSCLLHHQLPGTGGRCHPPNVWHPPRPLPRSFRS